MSVLAVDIGIGATTLGLFDDTELTGAWRVATDESRTADEWHSLVVGLVATDQISAVVISATVPSVLRRWRELTARYFADVAVTILGPGVRTGLAMKLDNPKEVGSDRIARAVAAAPRLSGPGVVIDLSLATTYDVIDGQGRFVGGAIAAGPEIALEGLVRRGAQLREVELALPRVVVATNTIEAMQSGLIHGQVAQVEGMVARIAAELGTPTLEVIVSGPLAALIGAQVNLPVQFDEFLTLRGMQRISELNANPLLPKAE